MNLKVPEQNEKKEIVKPEGYFNEESTEVENHEKIKNDKKTKKRDTFKKTKSGKIS